MGDRARRLRSLLPATAQMPGRSGASQIGGEHVIEGAAAAGVIVPPWDGGPSQFDAARVPARNPHFVFNAQLVAHLQLALRVGAAVLIVGDAGRGKTALVEQIASLARAPLVCVQGHAGLLAYDLFGIRVLRNGMTVFEEGPFVVAWRNGYWFLLDEITAVLPGTLQAIHAALDGARTLLLPDGTVVPRGDGFHLFATSNTAGAAIDRKHRYGGNHTMSDATLSRFGVRLRPPALSVSEVTALLLRWAGPQPLRPGIPRIAPQLAIWFGRVRQAAFVEQRQDGAASCVDYALTMRDLDALWRAYLQPVVMTTGRRWRTVREAAEATIAHAYHERDAKLVFEMLRTHVAEDGKGTTR